MLLSSEVANEGSQQSKVLGSKQLQWMPTINAHGSKIQGRKGGRVLDILTPKSIISRPYFWVFIDFLLKVFLKVDVLLPSPPNMCIYVADFRLAEK
jgi:hypothetical protein